MFFNIFIFRIFRTNIGYCSRMCTSLLNVFLKARFLKQIKSVGLSYTEHSQNYILNFYTDNSLGCKNGEICGWEVSSLETLFEPFLGPVRVSVVSTEALGVLPDVRPLRTELGTGRDAGLPLEADGGGGGGEIRENCQQLQSRIDTFRHDWKISREITN